MSSFYWLRAIPILTQHALNPVTNQKPLTDSQRLECNQPRWNSAFNVGNDVNLLYIGMRDFQARGFLDYNLEFHRRTVMDTISKTIIRGVRNSRSMHTPRINRSNILYFRSYSNPKTSRRRASSKSTTIVPSISKVGVVLYPFAHAITCSSAPGVVVISTSV